MPSGPKRRPTIVIVPSGGVGWFCACGKGCKMGRATAASHGGRGCPELMFRSHHAKQGGPVSCSDTDGPAQARTRGEQVRGCIPEHHRQAWLTTNLKLAKRYAEPAKSAEYRPKGRQTYA